MEIMLVAALFAGPLLMGIVLWFVFTGKSSSHPEVSIHYEKQKGREGSGR